MGIATGLERRGAVYYWRKRLPEYLAERIGLTHVRLSLRTKDVQTARFLGACLNAKAADLLMTQLMSITEHELKEIFRITFEQHRQKLTMLANFSRDERSFSAAVHIADEEAKGWAFCIFSKKGPHATIDDEDRQRFREKGLSEDAIERIEAAVDDMSSNGESKPSEARLMRNVEAVGAKVTAGTMATARPIYLQAMGEALLLARKRYQEDPLDFASLVASCDSSATSLVVATESQLSIDGVNSDTQRTNRDDPDGGKAFMGGGAAVTDPYAATDARINASTIEAVGTELIAKRCTDQRWDPKTARQARMIFDLFGRFLREEANVSSISDIKQNHLDAFEKFLRQLHKSYGKSPKDRKSSINELRRDSEMGAKSDRGLTGATRNRHLTFINQLIRRAKSSGIEVNAQLDLTELRSPKNGRSRNDRPIPRISQVETFFKQPVFTGCADWDNLEDSGANIFHRAAYFGPMIAHYQGMRREEYCGLAVDDVIIDNGDVPYIHVCENGFHRLKNSQSVRNLALHPELIRLNFLEYLQTIRSLGYVRLFPDLYSASSKSPLGDRMYDELTPAMRKSGVTPHQIRHFFNNDLKQKRVSAEFRADLMGHGGTTETTERYCNPIDVSVQQEDLAKVAVVTSHLSPAPVQLVPWVMRNEMAPWSKAARDARST